MREEAQVFSLDPHSSRSRGFDKFCRICSLQMSGGAVSPVQVSSAVPHI